MTAAEAVATPHLLGLVAIVCRPDKGGAVCVSVMLGARSRNDHYPLVARFWRGVAEQSGLPAAKQKLSTSAQVVKPWIGSSRSQPRAVVGGRLDLRLRGGLDRRRDVRVVEGVGVV